MYAQNKVGYRNIKLVTDCLQMFVASPPRVLSPLGAVSTTCTRMSFLHVSRRTMSKVTWTLAAGHEAILDLASTLAL